MNVVSAMPSLKLVYNISIPHSRHSRNIFLFYFCIMHSAFNLFVFPNYMFTSLLLFFFKIFYERAMSSPEK